ncbi:MAG TPA: FkbM family methyltransferase [Actinomycetota bacterium]|nr:FkbM family methyltransferase [Actinomycetota bacterium]
MVSYAQNGEDVLLDRCFPRGKAGFYIDVGASDPSVASVTRHFYDLGWHGINVEPTTGSFERLQAERRRDINLNVAASDRSGELTFHEFPGYDSGVSTASEVNYTRHRDAGLTATERTVAALTLAEICERHVPGPIDFLSVDVEGHEEKVLAGADFTRWRPRVVLVEATEPTTLEEGIDPPRLLQPSHESWEPILLEAGYLFAAFDGINRFYVRKEDADLAPVLAVPVNFLDGYLTYAHFKLQKDLEMLRSEQYADWVANQTLRAEYQSLSGELAVLRAAYEKVERALTTMRAAYEHLRGEVAQAERVAGDALGAVADARAQVEHVSPLALAVARRLTAASSRYPGAARPLKQALRAGRDLKRSIDGSKGGPR